MSSPSQHQHTIVDPGEPHFCARCASPLELVPRGGRRRPHCPLCGWTYYAKNATGAAIAITQGHRLLLAQRRFDPLAGYWTLPAGYIEYGDSAADTAIREALEECGVNVALGRLLGVYFGTDDPRDSAHLIVYEATIIGGELSPGDDVSQLRWFTPNELPEHIAFTGQRQAIHDWAAPPRAEVH
ncbi:MAG: NUDIX domain-containing protein [Chloroflexi bacterium]|nr:NUDIX domain-containing protein [Chloroflexota bacterium]